jgi:hypothetical protein
MSKKLFYFSLLISVLFLFPSCYTKSDALQSQLKRDNSKTTLVYTKAGDIFEFNLMSKQRLIRGDFIEGNLINGNYKKIPLSEVIQVNEKKFTAPSEIYLYVIVGMAFLTAVWFAATSGSP